MKKSLFALVLMLMAVGPLCAQDADTNKYWDRKGIFNLSINQTGLVNWTAGGESSISSSVLFKYNANYAKGNWKWDNEIVVAYGGIIQANTPWRKTDDRVELNTNVGRKMAKNWFASGFVNFRTQMFEGYKYPNDSDLISTFMAPGYITMGLGFEWTPNKAVNLNLSPLAGKLTIVADQSLADAGAYGVDAAETNSLGEIVKKGSQVRGEFGANVSFQFRREVVKNVTIDTKVNFFSNYLENPQNIDVNWDFMAVFKVNDWLAANFTTNLIYDHDIDVPVDSNDDGVVDSFGPRTQFKQVIGIGLSLGF